MPYGLPQTPQVYPSAAGAPWISGRVTVGNALVFVPDINQWEMGAFWQQPAADGDTIEWPVLLDAGSYVLGVFGGTDNVSGIQELLIDGSMVLTIDRYSAGLVNNTLATAAFVLADPGAYTLQSRINGQNGASGGFFAFVNSWFIRPGP